MYTKNGYEVENEFNGYIQEKPSVDMCVTQDDEIISTHDYYKRIHPEKEDESVLSSRRNKKSVSSHFSQYMEGFI